MNVGLITEFGKKYYYQVLICELSQVKQGMIEKLKYYTYREQGFPFGLLGVYVSTYIMPQNKFLKGVKH